MRDELPSTGAYDYESGVINLDTSYSTGTHFIAYKKRKKQVHVYDSYGNLKPPSSLVKYFNKRYQCQIFFNHDRDQFATYNCGHLCLKFLLLD